MLVSVPFFSAEMAVDHFPLAWRVVRYRRHDLADSSPGKQEQRERERYEGEEEQEDVEK